MAKIRAQNRSVHFSPYTDNPQTVFENVTEKIFNAWHDDISYDEYVTAAEDRSVSAVNKSDLKDYKSDVEHDVNRVFEN